MVENLSPNERTLAKKEKKLREVTDQIMERYSEGVDRKNGLDDAREYIKALDDVYALRASLGDKMSWMTFKSLGDEYYRSLPGDGQDTGKIKRTLKNRVNSLEQNVEDERGVKLGKALRNLTDSF